MTFITKPNSSCRICSGLFPTGPCHVQRVFCVRNLSPCEVHSPTQLRTWQGMTQSQTKLKFDARISRSDGVIGVSCLETPASALTGGIDNNHCCTDTMRRRRLLCFRRVHVHVPTTWRANKYKYFAIIHE